MYTSGEKLTFLNKNEKYLIPVTVCIIFRKKSNFNLSNQSIALQACQHLSRTYPIIKSTEIENIGFTQ